MSETKLYNLFSPHIPIHSMTFPTVEEKGQKRSSGYAFIQCYCNQDVEDVIAKMNGVSVNVGELVSEWFEERRKEGGRKLIHRIV